MSINKHTLISISHIISINKILIKLRNHHRMKFYKKNIKIDTRGEPKYYGHYENRFHYEGNAKKAS